MAKAGFSSNNLFRDASHLPVQTGGSFVTSDATTVPVTSPLSYTTGVTTITVPDNAIELIINPSTALRISELSAMTTYDMVLANSKEAISCAKMQLLYIRADTTSGTANFRFTII